MTANTLQSIRTLYDGMKGHNYGLPDCLAFLRERMDAKPELNFWELGAITGDTVAQIYNRCATTQCEYCVSGYIAGEEHYRAIFGTMGIALDYVSAEKINADKTAYIGKVKDYIDRGLPVIVQTKMRDIPGWNSDVGTHCLIVGYEDDGAALLLLLEGDAPVRYDTSGYIDMNWLFAGEKLREVTLEELYLYAAKRMTYWLTLPQRDGMCFGSAAYRAWAEDIEGGRYEDETVDLWGDYGVYVCNTATSGDLPLFVLRSLAEMNPAYAAYSSLADEIFELLPTENPTGGPSKLWTDLEKLGAGLSNITRDLLCDNERRTKIAALLYEYADNLDRAVELLETAIK